MPYIDQADRDTFSPAIKEIVLRVSKTRERRPGHMNYVVSQLIRQVYGEKLKYSDYNEIIGFLECAKQEFYRARVGIYEDKKAMENGDIYFERP